MQSAVENYWTTITGVAAAVAIYLAHVGPAAPKNAAEWGVFISGLLVAALGTFSKDAGK